MPRRRSGRLWPKPIRHHGILGEEFGALSPDAEYCWVIDPIDGTRAFIIGQPLWGTLIGLTRDGVPLLGLMDQPFTGERFWAARARPTSAMAARTRTIRTRACASLGDALLAATSPDFFAGEDEHGRFDSLEPRRAAQALRRRLLQLLHARARPDRPRGRGGAQALRHSPADPDHRAGGRHRHTWEGGDPREAAASSPPATRACTRRR